MLRHIFKLVSIFSSLPKHFVIKALVRINIFQSKINPLKITPCSSWKLIKNWRLWKSVKIEGRVMSLHKIMLSQVKEFFLIPQLPEFQATRAYKWRKMRHGSKVVNEICCFCSYAKKDAFVRSFVDARRVVAISWDDNFSLISTVVLATYKMKYKLLPLLVSIPIIKNV